jgi:hypothetical protein
MNRHQLTYIDMHPQPVTHKRDWPWVVATVAVFALIGVLLAWRG